MAIQQPSYLLYWVYGYYEDVEMPSGGYGLDQDDFRLVRKALDDEIVKRCGMQVEWCATYATARSKGATPGQASCAAYAEWDL